MKDNNLETINPIIYPEWNSIITSFENCNIFHSSNWAKVLCETYSFIPQYLVLFQNNILTSFIPFIDVGNYISGRKIISLPFTDFSYPIAKDKETLQLILEKFNQSELSRLWDSIETRGFNPVYSQTKIDSFILHRIDLRRKEIEIFSGFRKSTKRNINMAEKTNINITFEKSSGSMRQFYKLHCRTRKRHGLPPQPFIFFENIWRYIICENHGFIAIAEYNQQIIAANIYLHFGKKAIYKYGASNSQYGYTGAGYLIMWEAIKYYIKRDYDTLSLGRTSPKNTGLLQFKNGWGTQSEEIHYFGKKSIKMNLIRNLIDGNRMNSILKLMPLSILRIIGKLFYRYFA